MSTRNRTTFTVLGHHKLLYGVRNLFLRNGFALVSMSDSPDFCLVGAERVNADELCALQRLPDIPLFVLSTSEVYAGAIPDVNVTHKIPLDESLPLLVSSYPKPPLGDSLYSLFIENEALRKSPLVMVLRVFDVYGPGVSFGLVSSLVEESTKQGSVSVPYPGYQVRSFLYIDDFFQYTMLLCRRFLDGAFGIFNVGSSDALSLNNVAESVWQFTQPKGTQCSLNYSRTHESFSWFAVPDVTRVSALTGFTPTVSFRKGIWETVHNTESNLVVGD